jgi:hypothetical protein
MGMGATDYTRACDVFRKNQKLFLAWTESGHKDEDALLSIQNSVPAGLYEHWKSRSRAPKFYIVHGVGIEEDVHTPLVAYTALYGTHEGELIFRHLLDETRGFLLPVRHQLIEGHRYRLVTQLTPKEIATLLEYVGELSVIENALSFRLHAGGLIGRQLDLF